MAVANAFIARAGQEGISHMKAQKLVYFAYGMWLRENDQPFISEAPQVQKHGPQFASLSNELDIYRNDNIVCMKKYDINATLQFVDPGDEKVQQHLDKVWMRYGNHKAEDLSALAHQPGSPWYVTAKASDFLVPEGTAIPVETMKQAFRLS